MKLGSFDLPLPLPRLKAQSYLTHETGNQRRGYFCECISLMKAGLWRLISLENSLIQWMSVGKILMRLGFTYKSKVVLLLSTSFLEEKSEVWACPRSGNCRQNGMSAVSFPVKIFSGFSPTAFPHRPNAEPFLLFGEWWWWWVLLPKEEQKLAHGLE